MGWQPPEGPPQWMPAPPPGPPGPAAAPQTRLLSGRAIALVAAAIGLGILLQAFAYEISRDPSRTVDSQIRWSIVLTVLQYAAVAAIVLSQITPKVKLQWGPGSPAARVGIGAAVGLAGGGMILLLLHAAFGTLTSDNRVVLLMSGGDATRIVAAIALTCLAAPLVEEVLFRGLLLESLRSHNVAMGVVVSAMFFAVWHLNRQALLYYTAMGCIFGWLYVKRGLVASMTAHICFNGALTVAAVVIVLGPSHTYDVDGLELTVAAGWTNESAAAAAEFGAAAPDLALQGPDASLIVVSATPLGERVYDPDMVAQRLSAGSYPFTGVAYDRSSVRQADLPSLGRAVEVNFTLGALHGEDVLFAVDGQAYAVRFINGGSGKAESDFRDVLSTLRPQPVGAPAFR